MVASGLCVSCFFVGSEFVDLLSRRVCSGVFPVVGFFAAWSDWDGWEFIPVANLLLRRVNLVIHKRVYKYFI